MISIPLDAIEQRARTARPGQALMTALVLIPYIVGWILRKLWVGAVFLWVAAVTGWREAGGTPQAEQRDPYGQT